MQIAVTGATGFLGRRIAELAHARGLGVTAMGRDREKGDRLARPGLRFVPADLSDPDALRRAFAGADAVVHGAALSSPWGPHAAFVAANVDGTRQVVAACEAVGVTRLVHISTASVYFVPKDQTGLEETAPLPRPFNSYAGTKQQAETIARGFKGETMIMRPRGIFGPGDTALVPRLLAAARRRPLPLLRHGAARVSITHVDVAADAALAMCVAPAAACGTYNVSHAEDIGVRDLIETLLGGLRVPYTWRAIPLPVALGAARALETVSRLTPGQPEPIVTRYALALLAYSQTLDISAIRARLGWSPLHSLAQGLEQTIAAARLERAAAP